MKVTLSLNGREFESTHMATVKVGDYYIDIKGDVQYCLSVSVSGVRTILVPVLKEHTCGGVVFKETGEYRIVVNGEWYLGASDDSVYYRINGRSMSELRVVRPVRIEGVGRE